MGLTDDELLAAVYAAPDDDAPRAVYADWLSERGDPRGEFIALQLAAKKTVAATKREASLIAHHGGKWGGALDRFVFPRQRVFERGFLCGGVFRRELLDEVGDEPEWALVDTRVIHDVEDAGVAFRHPLRRIYTVGEPDRLPRLLAQALAPTIATLEARDYDAKERYRLDRNAKRAFSRLHVVSTKPHVVEATLRALPELTELTIQTGRKGFAARDIARIEAAIAGLARLKDISVPWDRGVGASTADAPRIELRFHEPAVAEEILDAVMAPPLSFTFDAIAVNGEHAPFTGDPRVAVKKELAKKRFESVAFSRKDARNAMRVTFTRRDFELAVPQMADFDAWLTRFLDQHEIGRFVGPFLVRDGDGELRAESIHTLHPIGEHINWLWGLGAADRSFFAFDDIVALAPAFPEMRIWKTQRNLVIVFDRDIEASTWIARHSDFELALTDAFWKQFERRHRFRPQDVIVKTLLDLGYAPAPHARVRDAAMGSVVFSAGTRSFRVENLVLDDAAVYLCVSEDNGKAVSSKVITTAKGAAKELGALLASLKLGG